MSFLKNPVILALDVDSKDEALKIINNIGDLVGAVKLGPRLIYRYGADFITEVAGLSPVFVDNKYFDIPSTMLAAVRASFEAGATLVTVHALAGSAALKELYKLEQELNQIHPFKILAVTILTSWERSSMPASLQTWSIEDHVKSLAQEVHSSGLSGLVCSGHELELLNYPNMFKVTPGIRLDTDVVQSEDQKRVMTPNQAIKAGASALVIGRPILQAQNPRETIQKILESCNI
ncbi:MAG: orotidine-5'-phosphate decarboxylase [Bdellovibrionota bacterium]